MNNVFKPDWWKHPLPDYLGPHPSNFVLNAGEAEAFAGALAKLNTILQSEGAHVGSALRAIRTQRVPAGVAHPSPVTMADVMQFTMELGKTSKFLLELMTAMATKRKEANDANTRG